MSTQTRSTHQKLRAKTFVTWTDVRLCLRASDFNRASSLFGSSSCGLEGCFPARPWPAPGNGGLARLWRCGDFSASCPTGRGSGPEHIPPRALRAPQPARPTASHSRAVAGSDFSWQMRAGLMSLRSSPLAKQRPVAASWSMPKRGTDGGAAVDKAAGHHLLAWADRVLSLNGSCRRHQTPCECCARRFYGWPEAPLRPHPRTPAAGCAAELGPAAQAGVSAQPGALPELRRRAQGHCGDPARWSRRSSRTWVCRLTVDAGARLREVNQVRSSGPAPRVVGMGCARGLRERWNRPEEKG
jgi:hypothetical protein